MIAHVEYRCTKDRGVALISVLFSIVLLLALVAVLVDIGTLRLQRTTADLFSLQALAGADGGTAWVRAELDQEHGDLGATQTKIGATQGKRRFVIDDHTYVVATESIVQNSSGQENDHVDDDVQTNLPVPEQVAQVESSAAVYADGVVVARRDTSVLIRVFPASPYSEVVGYVDDASAVGVDSPGDAAGQEHALDTTDLVVHSYQFNGSLILKGQDVFKTQKWSDGNTSGSGPLP
ncbi:MAG TPA: hypothetical protein VFO25_12265 [Candidatus Eremiobacteraceae bacterium]|nr:hypothetical protein [Candidatus Eremiobacteraceae bacterium]